MKSHEEPPHPQSHPPDFLLVAPGYGLMTVGFVGMYLRARHFAARRLSDVMDMGQVKDDLPIKKDDGMMFYINL